MKTSGGVKGSTCSITSTEDGFRPRPAILFMGLFLQDSCLTKPCYEIHTVHAALANSPYSLEGYTLIAMFIINSILRQPLRAH